MSINLKSIALPLQLAPRKGKYYGTIIVDANGEQVVRFWTAEGEPSVREKALYDGDWTPEWWAEYCCDTHWECEIDVRVAETLVMVINKMMLPTQGDGAYLSVRELLNGFEDGDC